MFQQLRQAIEGCCDLPHTGPHPGRHVMLFFGTVMIAAGAQRGWGPLLACLVAYVAVFGPLYLMGGYSRFHLNQAAQAKHKAKHG